MSSLSIDPTAEVIRAISDDPDLLGWAEDTAAATLNAYAHRGPALDDLEGTLRDEWYLVLTGSDGDVPQILEKLFSTVDWRAVAVYAAERL